LLYRYCSRSALPNASSARFDETAFATAT